MNGKKIARGIFVVCWYRNFYRNSNFMENIFEIKHLLWPLQRVISKQRSVDLKFTVNKKLTWTVNANLFRNIYVKANQK